MKRPKKNNAKYNTGVGFFDYDAFRQDKEIYLRKLERKHKKLKRKHKKLKNSLHRINFVSKSFDDMFIKKEDI